MSRGRNLAITLMMLALVAAAALAFVRTQTLKVAKPPVRLVSGAVTVAPGCRCPRERAELALAVRDRAELSVRLVPATDVEHPVRTLVERDTLAPGQTRLRWDGRDDAGRPVAAGEYRVRVELPLSDRRYTFSDAITVLAPRG